MKKNRLVIHFVGGDSSGTIWRESFAKDNSSLEKHPKIRFMEYLLDEAASFALK